jgi:hypothetical protein
MPLFARVKEGRWKWKHAAGLGQETLAHHEPIVGPSWQEQTCTQTWQVFDIYDTGGDRWLTRKS